MKIGVYNQGKVGYVKSVNEETGDFTITKDELKALSSFDSFDEACSVIDSLYTSKNLKYSFVVLE